MDAQSQGIGGWTKHFGTPPVIISLNEFSGVQIDCAKDE